MRWLCFHIKAVLDIDIHREHKCHYRVHGFHVGQQGLKNNITNVWDLGQLDNWF